MNILDNTLKCQNVITQMQKDIKLFG